MKKSSKKILGGNFMQIRTVKLESISEDPHAGTYLTKEERTRTIAALLLMGLLSIWSLFWGRKKK